MSDDKKPSHIDYWDKLTPEEKKWMKQFNEEYHYGKYPEDPIIKKKKIRKEANRNHTMKNTDLMDKGKEGFMRYIGGDMAIYEAFMEDANDTWSWQDAYHQGGINLAKDDIMNRTINDLENQHVDKKVTLNRFFLQMDSLRRLHQRSKK